MDNIKSLVAEVKTAFFDRFKNPLIFSYVFAWLLVNWKVPAFVFIGSKEVSKIEGIAGYLAGNQKSIYLTPLYYAISFVCLSPFFGLLCDLVQGWVITWRKQLKGYFDVKAEKAKAGVATERVVVRRIEDDYDAKIEDLTTQTSDFRKKSKQFKLDQEELDRQKEKHNEDKQTLLDKQDNLDKEIQDAQTQTREFKKEKSDANTKKSNEANKIRAEIELLNKKLAYLKKGEETTLSFNNQIGVGMSHENGMLRYVVRNTSGDTLEKVSILTEIGDVHWVDDEDEEVPLIVNHNKFDVSPGVAIAFFVEDKNINNVVLSAMVNGEPMRVELTSLATSNHDRHMSEGVAEFYDVKEKRKVKADITEKVIYGNEERKRYALKGKTSDGRNLTKFISKEEWENRKI